jgi:N12 class adenine-specific DNA methylase
MEEANKVFEQLISLYDIADELENIGNDGDAIDMRIKLNIVSNFLVKEFGL